MANIRRAAIIAHKLIKRWLGTKKAVFVMFCLKMKHVAQAFQQGGHNFHGDSKKEGDTSLPS